MRQYRVSWFSPIGNEDPTRCIAMPRYCQDKIRFQCSFKRGHGPNGLYCFKHANMMLDNRTVDVPPDLIAEAEEASEAKDEYEIASPT